MVRVLIKSLYCLSFPQSIRMSFWWNGLAACLAGVLGHPPFLGKDIPILSFLFCLRGSAGVEEGLEAIETFHGSLESKVLLKEISKRLVGTHRQYKTWHHLLLCVLSHNLHWYSHSLGRRNWSRDRRLR